MFKKILYIVLVIVIVVGAGYSYEKLDFGRKTTMFFKMNFGEGGGMGMFPRAPEGRMRPGGEGGFRPRNMEGFPGRPPAEGGGGISSPQSDSQPRMQPRTQPGMEGGFRPPEGMRMPQRGRPQGAMNMWKDPRTGKYISLTDVVRYTFILAFFVMVARFLDISCRKAFGSKPSD